MMAGSAVAGPTPAPTSGPTRRRRWLVPLAVLGLLVLLWLAGLGWFAWRIARPPAPPPPTQGIVALTGGPGRVETALRLLVAQPDALLLITGIGGGSDLDTLASLSGIDPAPLAMRVTLGHDATTTRGNARETRAWARERGIRSLLVVTAPFHMPRALVELGRALPEVRLVEYPAETGGRRVSLRVLIGEYNKYLVAAAGLSRLLPDRDPPRPGHAAG